MTKSQRNLMVGLLGMAFLCCACAKPWLRPAEPERSAEEARRRLQEKGEERVRMSGFLRARMSGLSGLLSSADVDVAVETPAKVFLSVRSFFNQPMYVVATDGTRATAIDATGGQSVFLSGPATANAFEELLGAQLWPYEAVAVFLAIAPAAGAQANGIRYDHRKGTYTLLLREASGRRSEVRARIADDALVSWVAYHPDGKAAFSVTYSKLALQNGLVFPQKWELEAQGPNGSQSVVFEAVDLTLNGEAFVPELFQLIAPPGAPHQPISPAATPPNPEFSP